MEQINNNSHTQIGDTNLADNYRGISLLSRQDLYFHFEQKTDLFVNMYGKVAEAQACFRDSAFILMSVIQKYLCKKKGKIYVCFVDFQKAFDSIHRSIMACIEICWR